MIKITIKENIDKSAYDKLSFNQKTAKEQCENKVENRRHLNKGLESIFKTSNFLRKNLQIKKKLTMQILKKKRPLQKWISNCQ